METVLLEKDFAVVSVMTDKKLGMIQWKGKASFDGYKEAFESILGYAEVNHNIDYYISDIRNQAIVSPEMRKWFQEVALPRAVAGGLKRAAVIMDGNAFKKYYMNMILQMTNKFGLPLKLVSDFDEAYDFLFRE